MAQSRLEKIGTIFTRVSGLLRSGAMKPEEKPIWYTVYAAFPPKLEPRFDRPAPNSNIRNIFYEEDLIRAKYHKSLKHPETLNMSDVKHQTQTQQFIAIYDDLKAQGPLDDEQIFATAQDMLAERRQNIRAEPSDTAFADAIEQLSTRNSQPSNVGREEPTGAGVNIQNIFKE